MIHIVELAPDLPITNNLLFYVGELTRWVVLLKRSEF